MKSFFVTALVVFLGTGPVAAQDAGKIVVQGVGQVQVAPDLATVVVGVTSEAPEPAAALNANSASVSEVLQNLSDAGVKDGDLQTSGLTMSPLWSERSESLDGMRSITGYVVSNQVTARVRDLSELGEILAAVVENGANEFHSLSFGVIDPEPASDQARQLAVADAMRKAKLFAEAAGVELGPLLELTESGADRGATPMARNMAAMEAVPIAQGEVNISAQVTMVFGVAE